MAGGIVCYLHLTLSRRGRLVASLLRCRLGMLVWLASVGLDGRLHAAEVEAANDCARRLDLIPGCCQGRQEAPETRKDTAYCLVVRSKA